MERTNDEMTSGTLQSVSVAGGYTVNSHDSIEQEDCGLIRGYDLQVKNADGQVMYENLRAFLPLNSKVNLVRFANKVWMLVYINGAKEEPKKVKLQKVNLKHNGVFFLFDESGKLHLNQISPHYQSIDA